MLYQPSGRGADHRNDTNTTRSTTESHPHPQASPILWGNHCGSDDRGCHTHTHTQPHKDIVPKIVATPLTPAVYQGPTSRRCGCARRRSTPTPGGDAQTTHRARAIVLCALRRHACPQSNAIGRRQAGIQPHQHKHIEASPPYGEDTPGRRQVQRKEKDGYISKEFCANTDLYPFASPRVALVGVRLLRHPDNGNTR